MIGRGYGVTRSELSPTVPRYGLARRASAVGSDLAKQDQQVAHRRRRGHLHRPGLLGERPLTDLRTPVGDRRRHRSRLRRRTRRPCTARCRRRTRASRYPPRQAHGEPDALLAHVPRRVAERPPVRRRIVVGGRRRGEVVVLLAVTVGVVGGDRRDRDGTGRLWDGRSSPERSSAIPARPPVGRWWPTARGRR